jgi:CubicO group peptidase (beta-lactamase class C family)
MTLGMQFDAKRLARIDAFFQRYVDDGKLPGWQLQVAHHGEVVHEAITGLADVEAGRPVATDTLWRIYSMTKPITSVVAMSLWEEGAFELTDEISRFIPSFAHVKVWDKGSSTTPFLVPAVEPVRMWHLLTHTSGLTYGFVNLHPVDALYRQAGFDFGWPKGFDLAAACDAWAELPLRFQPGSQWGYGVSTDVLGRVIEVITGKRLDEVVRERVLEPLGMRDTRWWVEGADTERLAALYAAYEGQAVRYDPLGAAATVEPAGHSGGGGLISTAADYLQFQRMLMTDGGGLLAPRTLDLMTRNHLPGGQDLAALNSGGFAETVFDGVGFGLGFAVAMNPTMTRNASSAGEFYWGGLASTAFWCDPSLGVTASFYTQLVPSSTYPIRNQLRQLVYSALMDG